MASEAKPKKRLKPPPMPDLDADTDEGSVLDFLFGDMETPAAKLRKEQKKIWDKQDAYNAQRDRKQLRLDR